jgi:hypothetical protein
MLRDDSGNGGGRPSSPRNVLGDRLDVCSIEPKTGFFRDGWLARYRRESLIYYTLPRTISASQQSRCPQADSHSSSSGLPSRSSSPAAETSGLTRPSLFCGRGNHVGTRCLPGGAEGIRTDGHLGAVRSRVGSLLSDSLGRTSRPRRSSCLSPGRLSISGKRKGPSSSPQLPVAERSRRLAQRIPGEVDTQKSSPLTHQRIHSFDSGLRSECANTVIRCGVASGSFRRAKSPRISSHTHLDVDIGAPNADGSRLMCAIGIPPPRRCAAGRRSGGLPRRTEIGLIHNAMPRT